MVYFTCIDISLINAVAFHTEAYNHYREWLVSFENKTFKVVRKGTKRLVSKDFRICM